MNQSLAQFLVGCVFVPGIFVEINVILNGKAYLVTGKMPLGRFLFVAGLLGCAALVSILFLLLLVVDDWRTPELYWPLLAGALLGWRLSDYLIAFLRGVIRRREQMEANLKHASEVSE